ncbi:MAG: endonuclease/exonuclease/phosphatase family protein [Bacteroidota bacterium]
MINQAQRIVVLTLIQILVIKTLCIGQNSVNKRESQNQFLTSEFFDDNPRGEQRLRLAFYNVENLFDIYDDPTKRDNDFTPSGTFRWNDFKYRKKLSGLGKTLTALGGWEGAALIGLCEVENKLVLSDLTTFSPLSNTIYEIVHYESPDRRGIDVALLYRPDKFKLLHSEPITVKDPDNSSFKTRDILYVKGKVQEEELHLFVNHWPSRRGGKTSSEPKRELAAKALKEKVDSLLLTDSKSNIIIMGDFNDYPDNKSISDVLKAGENNPEYDLVNLMTYFQYKTGTHVYQGKWGVLDQFIVSKALINANDIRVSKVGAQIFRADWLLTTNASGSETIFRTNQGPFYKGGYSDHLPIILDIELK